MFGDGFVVLVSMEDDINMDLLYVVMMIVCGFFSLLFVSWVICGLMMFWTEVQMKLCLVFTFGQCGQQVCHLLFHFL